MRHRATHNDHTIHIYVYAILAQVDEACLINSEAKEHRTHKYRFAPPTHYLLKRDPIQKGDRKD